jgi:hypothetical protein
MMEHLDTIVIAFLIFMFIVNSILYKIDQRNDKVEER